MNRQYSQTGMTFLGFVFTLGLVIFFGTLLFKVGPIYTEHATIKAALKAAKSQPDILNTSGENIADAFRKRLEVNNVSVLTPQNIGVVKHGNYLKIQVVYDQTVHLFANLDVVAHFNDVVEVGSE